MPGAVLGSEDIAMNRTDQVPVVLVLLQSLGRPAINITMAKNPLIPCGTYGQL